ncbi:hypothetical protein C8R43DRAFT_947960 [Mycena crocata]|nr:hypothetical protein C8R43DRAFT_947960 [Mycena crocata]
MPPGCKPSEPNTKYIQHQEAQLRYHEKNKTKLQDDACVRMQKLRAARSSTDKATLKMYLQKAREADRKYRNSNREDKLAAAAERRARDYTKKLTGDRESRDKVLRVFGTMSCIEAATWEDLEKRWYNGCNKHHVHGTGPFKSVSTASTAPSTVSSSQSTASTLSKNWSKVDVPVVINKWLDHSKQKVDRDAREQRQRQRNCDALAEEADLDFSAFTPKARVSAVPDSPVGSVRCTSSSPTKLVTCTATSSPTKPASTAATSPTKAAERTTITSPTKPAERTAVNSTTKAAAGVTSRSPSTDVLGFAPPYWPGDVIGPTPLLPSMQAVCQRHPNAACDHHSMRPLEPVSDSSEDSMLALQSCSDSDSGDDDASTELGRSNINAELAELFHRTNAHAFGAYQHSILRDVLLYAVSGHNLIFQDREHAVAVLRESPNATLLFAFDEAAILSFIDEEAARMSVLNNIYTYNPLCCCVISE